MFTIIAFLSTVGAVLLVIAVILFRKKKLEFKKLELKKLRDGLKSLCNILNFLSNIPSWINYYNNLKFNVHILREKNNRLKQRLADMRIKVENAEFETGRCRKGEVDLWLNSTQAKCTDVQKLLQRMENRVGKFIYQAWLGNLTERKIREVVDLYDSGVFGEVLSCVRRLELVTTTLVGEAAKENLERIKNLLSNQVTKIGVCGIKGIGKTALMIHIHNHLLRRNHDADVITIFVSKDHEEKDLQGEIARELGLNLDEEDSEEERAALLLQALKQKNFVLILDGLQRYVSEDRIGIPLGVGIGKMIVTSRSLDVCRRIGCHNDNIVAMVPLLHVEAFELFTQTVGELRDSNLVNVANRIVEQCMGVPLKIVDKGEHLRGSDDISIWEDTIAS